MTISGITFPVELPLGWWEHPDMNNTAVATLAEAFRRRVVFDTGEVLSEDKELAVSVKSFVNSDVITYTIATPRKDAFSIALSRLSHKDAKLLLKDPALCDELKMTLSIRYGDFSFYATKDIPADFSFETITGSIRTTMEDARRDLNYSISQGVEFLQATVETIRNKK